MYTVCRSDASKLLFQPGYLKVLKSMALSGQLQQYNIRSVVWRVRERGGREEGSEGEREKERGREVERVEVWGGANCLSSNHTYPSF